MAPADFEEADLLSDEEASAEVRDLTLLNSSSNGRRSGRYVAAALSLLAVAGLAFGAAVRSQNPQEMEASPEGSTVQLYRRSVSFQIQNYDVFCNGNQISNVESHKKDYADLGSAVACEKACSSDSACTHYLWKDDATAIKQYHCATFSKGGCDTVHPYKDGNNVRLYKRLPRCNQGGLLPAGDKVAWVNRQAQGAGNLGPCPVKAPPSRQGHIASDFGLFMEDKFCNDVKDADGKSNVILNSESSTPSKFHASQDSCMTACASIPGCNYYLWKEDPSSHSTFHCAHFKSCDSVRNYEDGDGAAIFIRRSTQPVLTQFEVHGMDTFCTSETPIRNSEATQNDAKPVTQIDCAKLCLQNKDCHFYLWQSATNKDGKLRCANFKTCSKNAAVPGGQAAMLFKKKAGAKAIVA